MTADAYGARIGAQHIVPIAIQLDGRAGTTLWAPPWRDADSGDLVQGMLGDVDAILVFDSTQRLHDYIAAGEPNDLVSHPAWPAVVGLMSEHLRATDEFSFDFDGMYEVVTDGPIPDKVVEAVKLLYMVSTISDSCGDHPLSDWLNGDAGFAPFLANQFSADNGPTSKEWYALQRSVHTNWETITDRLGQWIAWRDGTSADSPSAAPFTPPWKNRAVAAPGHGGTYMPVMSQSAHSHENCRSPASQETSGLAIAAFVLALAVGFGILPVIFGHAALSNIKRTGKSGRGFAIAALVLGYIQLALILAIVVAFTAASR